MSHAFPRPRKALGQNFLTDHNIVNKILKVSKLEKNDCVLEVGPGRGALTRLMADSVKQLTAVEFDRDLAAILREMFDTYNNVTIYEHDILKTDLQELLQPYGEGWKLVANLPYNISTPVLFRFLENRNLFSRIVVMLQKEVGDRLAAPANCSDYGIITVIFRQWFDIVREFVVPSGCFFPAPKVESVVISMVPLAAPRVETGNQILFEKIVRAAFAMRRKTLINCLSAASLAEKQTLVEALSACYIDPHRRGETLTLDEFAALSRYIADS